MSVSSRLAQRPGSQDPAAPLPWGVFIRQNIIRDRMLWLAVLLAGASIIACGRPWREYAGFIDGKTLACLFCLMAASGLFMLGGLFELAAAEITGRSASTRRLTAAMLLCTFFSSMLITNDVALIIFVPMTIIAHGRINSGCAMAVILQTVAANVGSALLPTGNPQNLFLYSRFAMDLPDFILAQIPLCAAGGAVLTAFCLALPAGGLRPAGRPRPKLRRWPAAAGAVLFAVALAAVLGGVDHRLALAVTALFVLAGGKAAWQQIDYALLLTFIGFFVFAGNVAGVDWVREAVIRVVAPSPFLAAAAASQIISNVPAAIMLAEFVETPYQLLAGVTAGGCGTLVASMASLISFRLYVRERKGARAYLVAFTLVNLLFLAVLSAVWLLFGRAD